MAGLPFRPGWCGLWAAATPFTNPDFLLTVGLLVAALLFGAIALYFIDRWRNRQLSESTDPVESLTSFRSLYERGELTEAEYQVVRDRMTAQLKHELAAGLKQKLDAPRPAPSGPPPEAPPPRPAAPVEAEPPRTPDESGPPAGPPSG